MKIFRLVVALRLASFPLIFNLSIAQEVEVNTENFVILTQSETNVEEDEPENETPMDSSSQAPQNDNNIVPLYERGYGEAEGIFSGEEEKILSPQLGEQASDSSFQKGAQEVDITDSLSQSEWQENLDLPNLIISEVYRLWTTERIEITNLSDEDFSWKLSLSWSKSSLYTKNLDIPSYASIILADKAKIWLINDEILAVNNAWFNIADSDEISVSLIYSLNEIDTFNVDKSVVSNNQIPTSKPRPTFQKIYDNWREVQITTQSDSYNITWNFIANPWKIIIKNWNPWIWNWPTDYPYNSDDSWNWDDSWTWTWSYEWTWNSENPWSWDNPWIWTWDSNIPWTWNDSWISDEIWTWDIAWEDSDFNLIISEVFYDDEDERIEIFNIWNGDFFWDLILSWSIYSDNKNYTYQNIQIPAKDFIITDWLIFCTSIPSKQERWFLSFVP